MPEPKSLSGLILLNGNRLTVNNQNPNLPAISVNGEQLSYKDINLASIRIQDDKAFVLDSTTNTYREILHTNSQIEVAFEEDEEGGETAQIQEGQIITAGNSLLKQQSPAPFCFINTAGRLSSANLWTNVWEANVMGFNDVDKASNTYNHGLCPAGDSNHQSLFLRKDGQWGMPSAFTGSVSETLLSLQDTPATYMNCLDRYLRVSFAEGGSIVFDAIDTSKVPEDDSNLYYTDERVDARVSSNLADKSISNISISGTLICNELQTDSDRRLKRDICDIDEERCMNIINDLQPKKYRFKTNDKSRYGLIAQEVKTIIPEIVNTSNETMSINYLEIIPILIGGMKRMQQEINCLKYDLELANEKISGIHYNINQLR